MARATREQIYAALFALVSQAKIGSTPAFNTTSRRWVNWSQVSPEQQPALFQTQRKEQPRTQERPGIPPRWTLHVDLWIYVNPGADLSIAPSQILNPILDAIEAVIPFSPPFQSLPSGTQSDYQRLGFPPGVVQEVRIMDDEIVIEEGLMSPQQQTVALVPVRIIRT